MSVEYVFFARKVEKMGKVSEGANLAIGLQKKIKGRK